MRLFAAVLLFTIAAPLPEIRYFRYERPVEVPAQTAGQACFLIDPAIFADAEPQLADLRLYRGATETPFVIQLSAPSASTEQRISPLNLGSRAGQTVFDAAMPKGRYSDIDLGVVGHDFIATVAISGSQTQSAAQTRLGSYTVFDLSRQKLGRSTVLHLPESDFPYLHFRIAAPITPENVTGLSITRLPASQPRYVTVAASSQIRQKGRETVIGFQVPQNTPVERVVFVPGRQPANFSRDVTISVSPISNRPATDAAETPQPVTSSGNLLRIHQVQDGHHLDEERLSVSSPTVESSWNATPTALDAPTAWTVTVENGDDVPIQLTSVRLEMLERTLCFDAAPAAAYTLFYGDSALAAPRYDYAQLFQQEPNAAQAHLGVEQANPAYQQRPDSRPFTERHPALLWVALAFAIGLLGLVALRSARQTGRWAS
ncbi:MAG TPA: DUF3999 family protein [Terracidiphilus sp.]|nr:DUF3999 family protein [Terracidiphilus sp.]